MEGGSRRRRRRRGGDRLSFLPNEILSKIFSPFNMIEIIKFSLVSKRYRSFYQSHPVLRFNSHPSLNLNTQPLHVSNYPSNLNFENSVSRVLNGRPMDSAIEAFHLLSFQNIRVSNLTFWVQRLLQFNIHHLSLQFYDPDYNSLALPPPFFTSTTLTTVVLHFGMHPTVSLTSLSLPDSIQMPNLKKLAFHYISNLTTQFFNKFILGCPLLETLDISHSYYDESPKLMISSQNLKQLSIIGCMFKNDGDILVTLRAPRLTSSTCHVYYGVYLLEEASSLEFANIDITSYGSHIMIPVEDEKRTARMGDDSGTSTVDNLLHAAVREIGEARFVKLSGSWKYENGIVLYLLMHSCTLHIYRCCNFNCLTYFLMLIFIFLGIAVLQ